MDESGAIGDHLLGGAATVLIPMAAVKLPGSAKAAEMKAECLSSFWEK